MKKSISILMFVLILSVSMATPTFAVDNMLEEDGIVVSTEGEGEDEVTTIVGEENIKAYQESLGEEYDPNLIAVRRTINNFSSNEEAEINPFFIRKEYYIKNKRAIEYTNLNMLIKEYRRPAGRVSINEGVNITTSFTADAGISAELLKAKLGFSVSSSNKFQIAWSGNYSYPIKIRVYPVYQRITGEVWDKDIKYDDFIGRFTVNRAIGDDIRVYRQ